MVNANDEMIKTCSINNSDKIQRRHPDLNRSITVLQTAALPLGHAAIKEKSGKRDLNPRLQPWQGCTLPLSYSRV